MVDGKPSIILVTGIMASGKSTVAQLLSEQFDKSVHLRGDIFRKMVVNSRKEVQPDEGEADEGMNQLRLRHRLAAQAAEAYAKEGFTVVVQDIVIGRMLAEEFIPYVHHRPFHVVVLCPDPSVVAQREARRKKKGYGIWTVEQLDTILRTETPRIGIWLDTSELTAEETVAELIRRLENDAGI